MAGAVAQTVSREGNRVAGLPTPTLTEGQTQGGLLLLCVSMADRRGREGACVSITKT